MQTLSTAVQVRLAALVILSTVRATVSLAETSDSKNAELNAVLLSISQADPMKTMARIVGSELVWKEEAFNCFQVVHTAKVEDLDFAHSAKRPNDKTPGQSWVSIPCKNGACVRDEAGSRVWPIEACPLQDNDNKISMQSAFDPASMPDQLADQLLISLKQFAAVDASSGSAEAHRAKAEELQKRIDDLNKIENTLNNIEKHTDEQIKANAELVRHLEEDPDWMRWEDKRIKSVEVDLTSLKEVFEDRHWYMATTFRFRDHSISPARISIDECYDNGEGSLVLGPAAGKHDTPHWTWGGKTSFDFLGESLCVVAIQLADPKYQMGAKPDHILPVPPPPAP